MRVRLEPSDEYMHPGPEPTFNESMYFNVYDPIAGTGGFVRIGNRPNEGYAEMTVCLYLPNGRAAFMFGRPKIEGNDRFDAGGARFEVHSPFEKLSVTYEGSVIVMDDPLVLADPREAFANSPKAAASVSLSYEGAATPFGGEPEVSVERPGEEFAKGHYEQLVTAVGTIAVGDETWQIDGRGLRDHSWGPRTWQAPWYYRWLTVNLSDGTGMMLSRIARPDSDGTRSGFVWDGETIQAVRDVQLSTEWSEADRSHQNLTARFSVDRDRYRTLSGRVLNMVPLRNRRDGKVTRISEGVTEWHLDQPLTEGGSTEGYGWSEYLDQIIDGSPAGLAE